MKSIELVKFYKKTNERYSTSRESVEEALELLKSCKDDTNIECTLFVDGVELNKSAENFLTATILAEDTTKYEQRKI